MPAERLFTVVAYEIGLPAEGERLGVAIRFRLPDGSAIGFALTPEIATGLSAQLRAELETLATRPDPASH